MDAAITRGARNSVIRDKLAASLRGDVDYLVAFRNIRDPFVRGGTSVFDMDGRKPGMFG
jgi:hypothetical protein